MASFSQEKRPPQNPGRFRLRLLRQMAEAMDITAPFILQCAAIKQLAPEMANELISGKRRRIDAEIRQVVLAAFWEMAMQGSSCGHDGEPS
jgi:hypothetical protein